ncbi:MAG: glycosyltransferase family 2 protein [Candidatus Omnitrophica bacterium]|nr:glycosyltransferase family 2 protein [Candidatus Omnitrophota bacterium]
MPEVSVIILAKNEESHIEECLKAVVSQEGKFSYEIIVIDSGSSDRTVEITRKYPIKLVQIPFSDFGHGKTRNLGASLAQGKYVVFLNGDTIPQNRFWLSSLIKGLDSPFVAGVYSRIYPPRDCNPIDERDVLTDRYLFSGRVKCLPAQGYNKLSPEEKRRLVSFHTISCAIGRDTLLQHPFSNIAYGEDLEWSMRMLNNGFKIIFAPESEVVHAHTLHSPLIDTVKRYFDDSRVNHALFRRWTFIRLLRWAAVIAHESIDDFSYIAKSKRNIFSKLSWIVYSPIARTAEFLGIILGALPFLPRALVDRLSLAEEIKRE